MQEKAKHAELVKGLARAESLNSQHSILISFLQSAPSPEAAEVLEQLTRDATSSPSHAKAFLNLLDMPKLRSAIGRQKYRDIEFVARNMPLLSKLMEKLKEVEKLDARKTSVLKAKVALVLQMLFVLGERMEEDGKPKPVYDGTHAIEFALEGKSSDPMVLSLKLDKFSPLTRPYLADILKESDFREVTPNVFEYTLSEAMVKRYADGSALVSLVSDEDTKVADVLIARMGEHILRRLSLLIRGIHMYPADHPALQPSINTLYDSIMRFLEHKDKVTLTRMGSEFLVDDTKIRKKTRYLEDLAAELEERNITSITFFEGLKVEELKLFAEIFTEPIAHLKRKGGVKGALEKKMVHHITVDQFRYGLVSGEEETPASSADKALEGLVLTEVMTRLKEGKDISGLSPEEFAKAFKEILEGKFEASEELRKNLAQMLLGVDPDLANMLLIQDSPVRDKISWSVAQRILDQMLIDLKSKKVEDIKRAVQNLKTLLEMALSRQKETSIRDIVEGTIKALWANRSNPDAEIYILDLLSHTIQELIVSDRVDVAKSALEQLHQFIAFADEISRTISQPKLKRMAEAAKRAHESIITDRIIEILIDQLTDPDPMVSERAAKILSSFKKLETAEALFKIFLQPDRTLRRRALEIMLSLGEPAKVAAMRRIDNIRNPDIFPRDENGMIEEDKWFELRNAMEIVAQLGDQKERERILKLESDPDPRIRKEVLTLGMRIDPETSKLIALKHITDTTEVAKTAIGMLGALKNEEDLDLLFYHFQKRPDLRETIIRAVGMIGGPKAEDFLLAALKFSPYKSIERIFYDSPELIESAIKAVKMCGGKKAIQALENFMKKYKNPLKRALFMPLKSAIKSDELILTVQETLNSLKARQAAKTAQPKAGDKK